MIFRAAYFFFLGLDKAIAIACFLLLTLLELRSPPELDRNLRFLNSRITFAIFVFLVDI
jgi:hypothetical protein